jgi:2-dehydropantoate 2-reductase
MKILIVGAGAVGGYMGGRLAKAGKAVTFMARGAHLQALQKDGLTIHGAEESFTLPVAAVAQPEPAETFDLVLYCVKGYDLEGAIRQTRHAVSGNGMVLSLLNGVESEDVLAGAFGAERVIDGIAFIGSRMERPGVILQSVRAALTLGELNGQETDRILRLKSLFEKAGIPVRLSREIRRDRWRKLVWNAGFNPVCALTGLSAQEVLKSGPLRVTLIKAMEEVAAVAEALGYPLGEDVVQKQVESTERAGGEIIPSMLQDRRRSKPLEAESISGVVVRKGEGAGVATPINQVLYALTLALSVHPASG